jgi:hypothetical protein
MREEIAENLKISVSNKFKYSENKIFLIYKMNQKELMSCALCIVIGFLLYPFIQNGFCGKDLVEGYGEKVVGEREHIVTRRTNNSDDPSKDPIFNAGNACQKFNSKNSLLSDGQKCEYSRDCESYGKWDDGYTEGGTKSYSCYQNCELDPTPPWLILPYELGGPAHQTGTRDRTAATCVVQDPPPQLCKTSTCVADPEFPDTVCPPHATSEAGCTAEGGRSCVYTESDADIPCDLIS